MLRPSRARPLLRPLAGADASAQPWAAAPTWRRGLYTTALGSKYRERFPKPVPQWYRDGSRRTGLIALKLGMTGMWDQWGQYMPITVLHVDSCQVVQVKIESTDGITALQLGAGEAKPKNVPPSLINHQRNAGIETPKRKLWEFSVTPDAVLPVGTTMHAAHFVPGQYVDVSGISRSKGWQGPMKRWGFKGQAASHGVSKTHRAHGSTGQCQDPGRVFKGKKMAGRMGGERTTVQNCWLYKIDTERQLLYVKGQVPGPTGQWVRVTDAKKKPGFDKIGHVPFPTALSSLSPSNSDDGDAELPELGANEVVADMAKPVSMAA